MLTPLQQRADVIDRLGNILRSGGAALEHVPSLLREILEHDLWREWETKRGTFVRHSRFEDFVTTPPLSGLGASVDLVRRIVSADVGTLDLLDRAVQGRQGARTDLVDNVHEVTAKPNGNAKATALRRLRKSRPDLHARVLAGELSAHAAAVSAGFRHRTLSVPLDDVGAIARALRRHLDRETLDLLLRELSA